MTPHTKISANDRTLLPRGLIARRRFANPDYEMNFMIGQPVTILCTGEAAVVAGRIQIVGCLDEYIVEIVDADCDPLRVFEHQIA